MADQPSLTFYGWKRSRIYSLATSPLQDGRLSGTLPLTLTDGNNPADVAHGKPSFHIMGPGDIAGIKPQVILRTAPRPFTRDAEDTKLVHIDFSEPDLPWRYTPELATGAALHPWITVLVGRADVMKVDNNFVDADDSVYTAYDLTLSARWAHVQYDGHTTISRILSPVRLKPQSEYVAAIVPTFNEAGQPAWEVTGVGTAAMLVRRPKILPTYYWWRFWTAEEGDFATLASALKVITAQGLGKAPLHYQRGMVDTMLEVRGAITNLGDELDTPEVLAVREDLTQFKKLVDNLIDADGRKVIGLPSYGVPWVSEINAQTWTQNLINDARYRGSAGLGLWMGIEAQETLVDAAVTQMGALDVAAHRVRQLALGLLAARSLWARRLPDDPLKKLLILSPITRRMRTETGTVMSQITGTDSPLVEAVFSSAARRVLRRGTAQTRYSSDGLVSRDTLLQMFNQCPPPPEKSLPGLPHIDTLVKDLGLEPLEDPKILGFPPQLLEYIDSLIGQPVDSQRMHVAFDQIRRSAGHEGCELDLLYLRNFEHQPATRAMLIAANRECLRLNTTQVSDQLAHELGGNLQELTNPLADFVLESLPKKENIPCNPPDLVHVSKVIADAIDPTRAIPPAMKRVAATLTGIDITSLAPPQVPIGINFPTWTLLNQYEKEWLLPGVGILSKNSVVAMRTNPKFIDAYLVGINTQFMNEMHWRNIAVDRKSTPLRMFWGPIDFANTHERTPDIKPFTAWDPTTDLGEIQHQVLQPQDQAAGKKKLVMVFRTDLFRRYPSTLVYLEKTSAKEKQNDELKATPILDPTKQDALAPKFFGPLYSGALEPDVYFFAFDVNPDLDTLQNYWLVLDEPPSELRFRSVDYKDKDLPSGTAKDGSAFATETFGTHEITPGQNITVTRINRPTRVAISIDYLKEQGKKA